MGLRCYLALALAALFGAFASAQTPADAMIARVNGEPILLSQLKQQALDLEVPLDALSSRSLGTTAYRQALTRLVDQALLVQAAEQEGIEIDPTTLGQQVEDSLHQLKQHAGSEDRLRQYLNRRHLTMDELQRILSRRQRRRQMANRVVANRVQLDGATLAEFKRMRRKSGQPTEQVRLAQILVRPRTRGDDAHAQCQLEALELARSIGSRPETFLRRINAFKRNSNASISAGELGWIDPRTLKQPLQDALHQMHPGEVSTPVKTDNGYHILYFRDRRTARDLCFAEQFERERRDLIRRLRREASIQLFDMHGRPIQTRDQLDDQLDPFPDP